jgi:hypothetical protein
MNQRNHRIEQEIEQTLATFDACTRLRASPWFAHRVKARLTALRDDRAPAGMVAFARLRPALIALIVLLNLATAVVAVQRSQRDASARQIYIQSFASEYAFTTTEMLFDLDEP